MKVEQNISRLNYLMSLFQMTTDDLIVLISEGLRKPIKREEILSKEISVNHLKRIDKVFNKGLHYYLDSKPPETSRDASIFFRKTKFDTDLNIEARKIVNKFEGLKISLSAISKLAEIEIERTLPIYKVSTDPEKIAKKIRRMICPDFEENQRAFLKAIIGKLAAYNILVFEFVETWNKRDRANIDGFFLNPNAIVLKRQQNSFRREIFTLIHELGHYLLDEEEVEQLDISNLANRKLSNIERWCNDFAFYFLAGDFNRVIEGLEKATGKNDYHIGLVEQISKKTHLSQIAIFTRLLYNEQISQDSYNNIKADFDERYRKRQEEKKRQKELDKKKGISHGGSAPKPINSPLFVSTIQAAFYEGILNDYDVCKSLNISPDKLDKYIG